MHSVVINVSRIVDEFAFLHYPRSLAQIIKNIIEKTITNYVMNSGKVEISTDVFTSIGIVVYLRWEIIQMVFLFIIKFQHVIVYAQNMYRM